MSSNDAAKDFATLVPLYLNACEAEGKSPATLRAYAETLDFFLRYVDSLRLPRSPADFTAPDVYRYLAAVRKRGVSDSTQHRRHREVKHFFSWLRRMDIIPDNVFQRVPLIRLEQKVVAPYSSVDVKHILEAFDPTADHGIRNTAITLFLIDTGVRASELVGLDLEHLDFQTGRARIVHGKGRKQRIVAFGPQVTDAILRYLDTRGYEPGPLFRSIRGGGRLSREGLQKVLSSAGSRAGLAKVHAHRFRHTFATVAIRSAAREIDVQHLLGHSTSAMVRRYTRTYDSEQAASAHHLWSPAAQLLDGRL